MSEFGLQVRNAADRVIFDSRSADGGVCAGAIEGNPGTSTTVNFPAYAGRTARVVSYTTASYSISYASGYPSVTLTVPGTYVSSHFIVIFIY